MPSTPQNRFIGARSYEEKDSNIFFGREDEANDLFQLVNINSFTLLYGKSGLGKTSVLQAGLFPKLRKKLYLPVYIRVNYKDKERDFVKYVEDIFTTQVAAVGYSVKRIASNQTLWEYFHELPLKDENENIVTPVLVFDQFEEIFTLGTEDKSSELRNNTKQLVDLLSDLIENSPPESLDEDKRLELQFRYGVITPPVKIIFSFREEYLGDFYDLSKYIPSIAYSNLQYKLTPLTFRKGFDIINRASEGLFEEEAINETLIVISESSTLEQAQKRDIDSFLLSIFCENQIESFTGKEGARITTANIKKVKVQNLVYTKYQNILKELDVNESEKTLLEDRMLSPEGFRLPVYLDKVLEFIPKLREEKIRGLAEKKIIKMYSIEGQRVIEIIHDKYALSAKIARDFRYQAEQEELQVLKDREELVRNKAEEIKRIAENEARLERESIVARLKLAEESKRIAENEARMERESIIERLDLAQERAAIDKEKARQERRSIEQKAAEELRISEERALAAQTMLLHEQKATEEKLALKSQAQKRIMVAGAAALALAVLAFFLFFEARKQTRLANQQTDSLNVQKNTLISLNKSLQDTTAKLTLKGKELAQANLLLHEQGNTEIMLRRKADSLRKKAERGLLVEKALTIKADYERQRAEESAVENKVLAQTLKDSLLALINERNKSIVSKDLGQLLSSARYLQFTEPAAAFATIKAAVQLDSTDKQASALYDSLSANYDYVESAIMEGTFCSFTPEGRILMIQPDSTVAIRNIRGDIIRKFLDKEKIETAKVSADGKRLLTVTKQGVTLWSIDGRVIERINETNIDFVTFFHEPSNSFAIVRRNRINVRDNEGDLIQIIYLPDKDAKIFSVSADSTRLYVSSDKGFSIHNFKMAMLVFELPNNSNSSSFLIPNNNYFISIEKDVIIVHNSAGKIIDYIKIEGLKSNYNQVGSVVFSPDGRKALVVMGNVVQQPQQQQQQQNYPVSQTFIPSVNLLVDLDKRTANVVENQTRFFEEKQEIDLTINNAVFSSDNRQIAVTFYDRRLRNIMHTYYIEFPKKLLLSGNMGSKYPFLSYNFSPDGKFITTSSGDNKIKVWQYGSMGDLDKQGKLAYFNPEEVYKLAGIKE